uniref:BTB_2 domain-containing protein n=1 Tax=Heterorhabditis bacteriophora TaxID=37862 RepID=A0A1I7W9N8_HETBA
MKTREKSDTKSDGNESSIGYNDELMDAYHMNSPTVILDVEGVFFKTRISTLTSIKGSYFDKLFEKDWKKALDRVSMFLIYFIVPLSFHIFHSHKGFLLIE